VRRPTRTGQAGRGRASLRRVRRIRVLGLTRGGNFSRGALGSPGSSKAGKCRDRRVGLGFACVLTRSSSGRTANIACTTVRSTFDAVEDGDVICSSPRWNQTSAGRVQMALLTGGPVLNSLPQPESDGDIWEPCAHLRRQWQPYQRRHQRLYVWISCLIDGSLKIEVKILWRMRFRKR